MSISKKQLNKLIQFAVLGTIAIVLVAVIFIADIFLGPEIAVSSLYCLVILYSWIIPGKKVSIIFAVVISILLLIGQLYGAEGEIGDRSLVNLNVLFSFISLWICVVLVSLARNAFKSYDSAMDKLESRVLERTRKLNEINEELSQQSQALTFKNKELEQFAYIASHDLQEPLIVVESGMKLISKELGEEKNPKVIETMDYLNSSVKRMRELIHGLLNYSRLGNEFNLEEVDLQALLEEVKHSFPAEVHKAICFENLPKVQADKATLAESITLLIDNAIKFKHPDRACQVNIEVEQKKNHHHLKVIDNGIGIEEHSREKIFIIYKRLHQRGEYGGIGVGLSYAKKIVELHHGKIWVDSELGRGSTFNITLPFK